MPREAGRGNALDQTNVLTALLVSPVFLLVRLSEEDNPVELSSGRLPSTTPDQGLENDVSRGASSLSVLCPSVSSSCCAGGGPAWARHVFRKPPTCTCCQTFLQPVFTHVSMYFVPCGNLVPALWSTWESTRRCRFV